MQSPETVRYPENVKFCTPTHPFSLPSAEAPTRGSEPENQPTNPSCLYNPRPTNRPRVPAARPREWMRRPCMILMQPASAQPSGSWAGCQQQLIAQRDPAALARGWPALARRSGRLAGSIPPGQGCQPPLGAAYCRGSAGRGALLSFQEGKLTFSTHGCIKREATFRLRPRSRGLWRQKEAINPVPTIIWELSRTFLVENY